MTTARHWWALTPAASGGGAALALAQVTALLQANALGDVAHFEQQVQIALSDL
ncbi:hypothetical protein Tfont_00209 [Tepidimonas fonticaldi]|uniref:Uncharacterized protein n=1 Tax=Tepidimonas fonticaldi TaxID=1101373 RepID=A0A554XRC8_9BURK|nr:hypothetical protein [Tepidimonas fonticaldi]TSE38381.1 hypothetical protein Tfont_00209 [Tepidimonas fonticaldi]